MTTTASIPIVTHPVQLEAGPFHGNIYWVPPDTKFLKLALLDYPFKVGNTPGKAAVYETAGDSANFVGVQSASWEPQDCLT